MEFKKKTIIWESNNEPPKNYIWIKKDGAYEWSNTTRRWEECNLFDNSENEQSKETIELKTLTATENKTYTANEGEAYNEVVVNVPTTMTIDDMLAPIFIDWDETQIPFDDIPEIDSTAQNYTGPGVYKMSWSTYTQLKPQVTLLQIPSEDTPEFIRRVEQYKNDEWAISYQIMAYVPGDWWGYILLVGNLVTAV